MSEHEKQYRTMFGYLSEIAEAWDHEAGAKKREKWHPEDAADQLIPFATAFLLGWSRGLRRE